jgi:hypothetical protein
MKAVREILAQSSPSGPFAPLANAIDRSCDAAAPLRLWHLASLDAPTVAIVWSLAFAWAAQVRLPLWALAALALTVWSIYIGDRLLDARKAMRAGRLENLRDRHFFHWRLRRILAPTALAAAGAAGCMVLLEMPMASVERGGAIAVAALVYLQRVHFRGSREDGRRDSPSPRRLPKELLVGILFAAGCALPAWNRGTQYRPALVLPVVFFAALAWLNCHAIDRWEGGEKDARIPRIATQGIVLGVAGVLAAAFSASGQPRAAALLLCAAASALLLAGLDRLRPRLTPLALRAAADLVLLTPLALLAR